METTDKSTPPHLVRAEAQGLVVRSSALVARGLRDLARDSNWIIKKAFNGKAAHLAISSTGQLCAILESAPHAARRSPQRVVLYDVELSVPTLALAVPNEPVAPAGDSTAVFGWSPTGRYLVGGWTSWQPALHIFDLHGKMLLGEFGAFRSVPQCLAWSETGKYFAAASSGRKGASLRLWAAKQDAAAQHGPLEGPPTREIGVPDSIEPQQYGE
jgi:hypothetical protein